MMVFKLAAAICILLAVALLLWLITCRMRRKRSRSVPLPGRSGAGDETHGGDASPVGLAADLLARDTSRARHHLRSTVASQEQFLADVAHELKTPLAVLLSEAQILAQRERTPEEYGRFLTLVQDEIRVLSQIVESLLTLARAEGGNVIAASEVSLNELVMSAVERTTHLADQRDVVITPHLAMPSDDVADPVLRGDAALLSLMVSNLLRNAIRFAPPQTMVDLSIDVVDGNARIIVRDRGPGIPDEYIPRVFDRFFRVPGGEPSFHGVGLGLAIAKSVVDLHGGRISVVNHPDGGCRFTVDLPLSANQGGNDVSGN